MFYTVYKTTNRVNGNYYLGCHKTNDPCDSYLGSGRQILQAIAKYGRENFEKEVLYIFETEEAFRKERELIAAAQGDRMCYNMHEGGYGGWDYVNKNGLSHTPETIAKIRAANKGRKPSPKTIEGLIESNKKRRKHPERIVLHIGVAESNRRRNWEQSSREKIGAAARLHRRGKPRPESVKEAVAKANTQRTPVRWIHLDGVALKIEISKLNSYLTNGWQFGRKIKDSPVVQR